MALDTKLAPQPHPLDILVVGGAAIALLWNPNRLTRYVDVVERLPGVVEQAAAAVAAETEGLSLRWLNDAAVVARPTGLPEYADPTRQVPPHWHSQQPPSRASSGEHQGMPLCFPPSWVCSPSRVPFAHEQGVLVKYVTAKLKPGGVLALIVPVNIVEGAGWAKTRNPSSSSVGPLWDTRDVLSFICTIDGDVFPCTRTTVRTSIWNIRGRARTCFSCPRGCRSCTVDRSSDGDRMTHWCIRPRTSR